MQATRVKEGRRPLILMRLRQSAEVRKLYAARVPWWRRAPIGYLLCIPIVACGLGIVYLEHLLALHIYVPDLPLVLPVLLVALLWGVGPALCAALLCTLALIYIYVPPQGALMVLPRVQWAADNIDKLAEIMPFFLIEVGIAIIAGQRESARRRALLAELEAQTRAQDLEQLNEELKRADLLKDHFISVASHELKTPITTIRGQAQIALRRLTRVAELPPELENVRLALQKIDEQTYRLSALIDDMLALSSIQTGKLKLRPRRCDLVEICREAVEDQRLVSGRTITLSTPVESLIVEVDSDRLHQVLTNLLSNSIKYSPEQTPVEVSLVCRDGQVEIRVRDHGRGIPEDQREQIFQAFYRTPEAQASPKDGWGLGLAICKDIVERHGGRIWCEPAPDEGTVFVVVLPLSQG
ncbi:MAG: HAMP domain-containing histidine kinase [Thermogemmatispora sp.]|uniref:sensor histidine kinase n=1 Tax=Thermogemmatispora sp. TaxID=1968838 RepID=UPI0019E6A295|nr:HAMP domain-containing sensor histidine kinase [Thermogemmatispora sp.]MBE3565777.1 HAMP domain-containing histidine kinase [Thermogemmatispora sp.]